MKTIEQAIDNVKSLKDGESCTVNWFSEGGGHIERIKNEYVLSEVQLYGTGSVVDCRKYKFNEIEEMVNIAYSWT